MKYRNAPTIGLVRYMGFAKRRKKLDAKEGQPKPRASSPQIKAADPASCRSTYVYQLYSG